jgi:hypothetical protein
VTEVQELVARLRLKDDMTGPLRKVRAGVLGVQNVINSPRFQKGVAQIGTGIRNSAAIAGVGLALLTTQVAAGLNSLIELEKQTAQTNAVIKSTGGIAGITAEDVRRLSEEYESLNATVGDETIREAQNLLLTFTNVRKEAFEPALAAILDMNTAMGKGPDGLQSTVIAVGKALNDPIRGITALRRVGVQFTKDQEAQIKALVETNDVYGAQQIILAELNKEFGGSFLAQGDTTAGKVAKFRDAIEDLQRSLATALLPAIGKVADALSDFLQRPDVIKGAEDLGKAIGDLFNDENLAAGGRIFSEVFEAARAAAPTIAAAAKITGEVVKTAVSLFRSLPPELQRIAIGAFAINKLTGGLVTNLASGLIGGVLKQLVSGVVNVRGATVIVQGGVVPGGAGAVPVGGAGGGKLAGALSVVSKVFLVGMAAEAGSMFADPINDLGKSINEATGLSESPLADFGKAWDQWRATADWPFGQKNAPEWAGGEGPPGFKQGEGPLGGQKGPVPVTDAEAKAALAALAPPQRDAITTTQKVVSAVKAAQSVLSGIGAANRAATVQAGIKSVRATENAGLRTSAAVERAKTAVTTVTTTVNAAKAAINTVRGAVNAVRTTTATVKAATDRVDDAVERNITVLRNKKLGVRLYNTVSIRAQTVINGRVYQANVDRQNYYVKPGTVAIPE